MAKVNTFYQCSQCGNAQPKWMGQCPSCREWNTLELTEQASTALSSPLKGKTVKMQTMQTVTSHAHQRITSNLPEWDRVLGGGLLPGAFIILTGDPGIGKSTLLLQVAHELSHTKKVFYFSSEESLEQIKERYERLTTPRPTLLFAEVTHLQSVLATVEENKPDVIILDSIQNCLFDAHSSTTPGGVSQLKESGFLLMKMAKEANIAVIITAHITKEGHMAGPKILEHIVDAVFYLQAEDRWHLRILRGVKNRFGAVHEVGFFEMTQTGLRSIENINKFFLQEYHPAPGVALTCTLEGTRPLLLELQALCIETHFSLPQRVVTGIDQKRLLLIAALLEKNLKIPFSKFDIFFKVSGGCSIKESASDLGIALALLSSYFQAPLPEKSIALGEISLTGQIKPINYIDQRLKEAQNFGLTHVYLSTKQAASAKNAIRFSSIHELIKLFPLD